MGVVAPKSPRTNAGHVGIGAPNGRAVQLCAVRTPPSCGSYTRVPGVLSGPCGDGGESVGGGAGVCNLYPPGLQRLGPSTWGPVRAVQG